MIKLEITGTDYSNSSAGEGQETTQRHLDWSPVS